jgi:hypothetical protein
MEETISAVRPDKKKVSNAKLTGEAYYRAKCLKNKLRTNTFVIDNIINKRPS